MDETTRYVVIFRSDLEFDGASEYDVVEKFVKPYASSLRNAKQKYGIKECYVKGNVPDYALRMVEKLTKVTIHLQNGPFV